MSATRSGNTDEVLLDAVVVADDLTGAADTAVPFAAAGRAAQVAFAGTRPPAGSPVLAIDTDSRRAAPEVAARLVGDAVRAAPAARLCMKKIDSTLRGNVGPETLAALYALGGRFALCAPAFPKTARRTRDGVQWAGDVRVGAVGDCFAGSPVGHVPLAAVRAGRAAEVLASCLADGARIVITDAESDDDLDEVVRFGTACGDPLWVGSGGLGAALARGVGPSSSITPDPLPPVTGPALVVVGSGTTVAQAQANRLTDAGAAEVTVPAEALLDDAARAEPWAGVASAALGEQRDVVVRIGHGERIVAGHGRRVVEALARLFAPVVRQSAAAVVATGGETALMIAHALGAQGLLVHGELEPGVVHGRLIGGAGGTMVTKAGAFGDPGTLLRALEILRTATTNEQERL